MDTKKLEKKWPKLLIRNRTNQQKHIQYIDADGDGQPDSVTINGDSTRLIRSKGLLQIPNIAEFELVNPTLFELQEAGVIQLGEQNATEVEPGEPSIADSAAESGVIANANQRQVVEEGTNPDATADAVLASRPTGLVPPGEKNRNSSDTSRNRR